MQRSYKRISNRTLVRGLRFSLILFATFIFSLAEITSAQIGSWGTPVDLSDGVNDTYNLDFDVTPDGTRAIAVWYQSDGSNSIIRAATATINGGVSTWSSVIDISAAGQPASEGKVAISDDGTRATAIWRRRTGVNSHALQARSATISNNIATWGSTYDLSTTINPFDGQIALSSDGSIAAVIWIRWTGSVNVVGFSLGTITGNSGSWTSAGDISQNGESAWDPQLAITPNGTAGIAVWARSNGSETIAQAVPFTVNSGAANFGITEDLSDVGNYASEMHVGISSDGTKATTLWERYDGNAVRAQSASATITSNAASWSAPIELDVFTSGEYVEMSNIALSSDGTRAIAVWMQGGLVRSASATITANNASWGAPNAVSGSDAGRPQVALSADGSKAIAGWDRYFASPQKMIISNPMCSKKSCR